MLKYTSWYDPGFSYISKMTPCAVRCSPLLSKQLFKNSGNVYGRNDVKPLARLAGACPVQEICVFSIVLAVQWTADFLCKQLCGQKSLDILNSVSRFIYISMREEGWIVCVTWESVSELWWLQFRKPSCNLRVTLSAVTCPSLLDTDLLDVSDSLTSLTKAYVYASLCLTRKYEETASCLRCNRAVCRVD